MGVAYAHITASLGSIAVAVIDIIVLRDMLNKGNKGLEIVEMLEILRRYLSRVVLSFLGGFLVLLYNCWVVRYWLYYYYYIVFIGAAHIETSTAFSIYSAPGIIFTPLASI
jgi:hypothetical protein